MKQFDTIEEYDFKEVIDKYSLEDSIIALIFKNENEVRVLSRITIKKNIILKNQSFLVSEINSKKIIDQLKVNYEDHWKNLNQINTSIKLNLNIQVKNNDNLKIENFEKKLNKINLVYEYNVLKFDKDYIFYQIVFNGTPKNFLKSMSEDKFDIDTQNETWILK